MSDLAAVAYGGVRFLLTAQVSSGRGAAIAVTVALIVLALGQLRLSGTRAGRPLI